MVYKNTFISPKLNIKEALRYAGVVKADAESEALLMDCFAEADSLLSYKTCCKRYPVSKNGDEIDLGFCIVRSHSLALCLAECDEINLFCATVGSAIDRLIEKSYLKSSGRGVMMNALGSERVESLCDELCKGLAADEASFGRVICPRFSPGYGDLPLEIQKDIFSALDLTKNLGVNLNENLFMSPSKSVTAILGIKKG